MSKRNLSQPLALTITLLVALSTAVQAVAQPVAVRNDIPRVGQQEVLMLRHAFLEKGQYQAWYEASRDEVYLIARYASHAHYLATLAPDQLGGNGPDFAAFQQALRRRAPLTLEFSTSFMQGPLYGSPPLYMPALDENYRKID